jgi:hypothetical protein
MTVKTLIKTSEYHDSVSMMLMARGLSKREGVKDAAVVMGTEANKSILTDGRPASCHRSTPVLLTTIPEWVWWAREFCARRSSVSKMLSMQ